jgi:hypothetical protein
MREDKMARMTLKAAAIVLSAVVLTLTQPAEQAEAKKKGAFVGGLVAGAVLGGAAVALAQPKPYYYYGNRPYPPPPPPPPPGYAFPPYCGYYPYLPCAPRPYY